MPTLQPIEWNGMTYPSKAAFIKHFGIARSSFQKWEMKYGLQKACEYTVLKNNSPEETSARKVIWKDITYKNKKELAKHFHIAASTLNNRIRETGFQNACEYYEKETKKHMPISVQWNGATYSSINQLAKHLNANSGYLSHVIKNKKDFQTTCLYYEAKNRDLLNLKPLFTGRDNTTRYISKCKTCGQNLVLTEQEILNFTHSDNFCENHSINL